MRMWNTSLVGLAGKGSRSLLNELNSLFSSDVHIHRSLGLSCHSDWQEMLEAVDKTNPPVKRFV